MKYVITEELYTGISLREIMNSNYSKSEMQFRILKEI
jgi:hypothetical protein